MVIAALALFIAAAAFVLTRLEPDPFRGDAIVDPPFKSLTYGVQGFMWWGDPGPHLDWTRLMSFTHIKQTFAWQDISPNEGDWYFDISDRILEYAEPRNIELIVRLTDAPDWSHPSLPPQAEAGYVDAPPDDLNDYAEYCGRVAERYKGRITAYQIWNEPNLNREWGNQPPDAERFVEMLRLCSEAIRAADPLAILISPGLSPTGQHDNIAHRDDMYLQAMYNHGFQNYVDVVGVHAPGFAPPEYGPDDAEKDGRGRWATFRRVEDLRKIMVANGDAARQMAILETGYTTDTQNPTYSWFAVSEEEQAELLEQAYTYAAENWRPWVGLMSAIYLAKPFWTPENEEFWWAFNDPTTGRMRPVFAALAQMPKYCDDTVIPRRDPLESAFALEHNPCN